MLGTLADLLQQAQLLGAQHRLQAAMNAKLAEDVVDMCLHSADGYRQLARDLGIVHAIRQQS